MLQRDRAAQRQALPSVFTVRVLGFGNDAPEGGGGANGGARERPVGYDARSAIQVVGDGALSEAQKAVLTPAERRNWRP